MSDSEDLSDITTSSYYGSSGNEADSEGESYGKDLREITELMNFFNLYMFEPEKKDVSSTGSSSESKCEEIKSERQNETRVTNLDWCTCRNCKNEKGKLTACVAKKSMLSMGFFTMSNSVCRNV